MRKDVINSYNETIEKERLSSTKARKVEYLTTIKTIDNYITDLDTIADIGCGCGIYSIHYAEKEHNVISVDIVPKHITILKKIVSDKRLKINTYIGDATHLEMLDDGSVDIVFCLGPLYHLTDISEQKKCINECKRIVKHGGYIIFAYISCYAVFPYVIRGNHEFLRDSLQEKIINNHYIKANDEDCFWTDNYFHSPDEIEKLIKFSGLKTVEHLAADGQSIAFQQMINNFNDEEFKCWMNYHYNICHERSIIGSSNHGIIVARKDK